MTAVVALSTVLIESASDALAEEYAAHLVPCVAATLGSCGPTIDTATVAKLSSLLANAGRPDLISRLLLIVAPGRP